MTDSPIQENTGEILIYRNPEGSIKIDVHLEQDTVWLSQEQTTKFYNLDVIVSVGYRVKSLQGTKEGKNNHDRLYHCI